MNFKKRSISACLAVSLMAGSIVHAGDEPQREPKQTVARSEAVEALRSFEQDPLNNLEAANIFTTYVKEDGNVHVSMNPDLVPWMLNRSVPQRSKAILLSAFVAGNFRSQLDDESQLDDSRAGLTYTLEVYELLREEDPELSVPELDNLSEARQNGKMAQALDSMVGADGEEDAQ